MESEFKLIASGTTPHGPWVIVCNKGHKWRMVSKEEMLGIIERLLRKSGPCGCKQIPEKLINRRDFLNKLWTINLR